LESNTRTFSTTVKFCYKDQQFKEPLTIT